MFAVALCLRGPQLLRRRAGPALARRVPDADLPRGGVRGGGGGPRRQPDERIADRREGRPIEIAPGREQRAARIGRRARSASSPAGPGPIATSSACPKRRSRPGATVELDLQRLDQSTGLVAPAAPRRPPVSDFGPTGHGLRGRRWPARRRDAAGTRPWSSPTRPGPRSAGGASRSRWAPTASAEGRALPPIDPSSLVGDCAPRAGNRGGSRSGSPAAGCRARRPGPAALAMVGGGASAACWGWSSSWRAAVIPVAARSVARRTVHA